MRQILCQRHGGRHQREAIDREKSQNKRGKKENEKTFNTDGNIVLGVLFWNGNSAAAGRYLQRNDGRRRKIGFQCC